MAQKTTTADYCCLKTMAELEFLAGGLYTDLVMNGRNFGTAAAIEDNVRRGMTSQFKKDKAMPDGSDERIQVKIKYQIPRCGETDTTDVVFDCLPAAETKPDYDYEEVYFDDFVAEEFTMGVTPFLRECESPSEELAKEIVYKVRSMYSKYNRKLASKLVSFAGSSFEGTSPTSLSPAELKLFVQNGLGQVVPQPMGLLDLSYAYNRMAPNSPLMPVKIAGSKGLGAYQEGSKLFQGNVDGFDGPNNPLSNTYTDWQLPDILGDGPANNPLISFLPGSIDLLEWFEFDNPDKELKMGGGRIAWAPVQSDGELVRVKMDVGTPVFGRPFIVDMSILYDKCTNKVTYKMKKTFDLWRIPQSAFCPGTTWNYVMLWDLVCGPYSCADVINVPAPAAG